MSGIPLPPVLGYHQTTTMTGGFLLTGQLRVSVVIPALNEHDLIADAIQAAWRAGADQVVVVDGGSHDSTREIAGNCPCLLESSPAGRGPQQNCGASASDGEVLLFLHADCRLPPRGVRQIKDAIREEKARWGGFRQKIEATGQLYRWIERGNAWRANHRQLVYGDQGFWVERELFERVHGFPNEPLMEDVQLSWRLKRVCRPTLLAGPVAVNPRRWQKHGIIRQTARNWTLFSLYRLGVPPSKIARYYR